MTALHIHGDYGEVVITAGCGPAITGSNPVSHPTKIPREIEGFLYDTIETYASKKTKPFMNAFTLSANIFFLQPTLNDNEVVQRRFWYGKR